MAYLIDSRGHYLYGGNSTDEYGECPPACNAPCTDESCNEDDIWQWCDATADVCCDETCPVACPVVSSKPCFENHEQCLTSSSQAYQDQDESISIWSNHHFHHPTAQNWIVQPSSGVGTHTHGSACFNPPFYMSDPSQQPFMAECGHLHVSSDFSWIPPPTEQQPRAKKRAREPETKLQTSSRAKLDPSSTPRAHICQLVINGQMCGHKCHDPEELFEHLKEHVDSFPKKASYRLKCLWKDCRRTKPYPQMCHFKEHLQKHADYKPVICEDCGKGFINEKELNSHARVHSELRPFHCPKCGKGFKQESTRKPHLLVCQGPPNGQKRYRCVHVLSQNPLKMCEHQNHDHGNMLRHYDTHLAPRFSCRSCGKQFTKKVNASRHVRNSCTTIRTALGRNPSKKEAQAYIVEHSRSYDPRLIAFENPLYTGPLTSTTPSRPSTSYEEDDASSTSSSDTEATDRFGSSIAENRQDGSYIDDPFAETPVPDSTLSALFAQDLFGPEFLNGVAHMPAAETGIQGR